MAGRLKRGGVARVVAGLLALLAVEAASLSFASHAVAVPVPPRVVSVVMDDNYPPFIFRDASGKPQGILVDRWRLWERKTGLTAEIHAMAWGEAQSRMEAGEFDVIDTIFRTEKREPLYDFSAPYEKLEVPVFFDESISGISDARSLRGFPVAVKVGDAAVEFLRKNGVDTLVTYEGYEEIVGAARDRKVSVFVVDKPPALYFLYKFGIQDRFRFSPPLYVGEFHRAYRKGDAATLQLVEDGFAKITSQEAEAIDRTWYGAAPPVFLRYLWFALPAAAVALAAILLLALWNKSLRRRVAVRTAELEKEVSTNVRQSEALSASEEKYRLIVENSNDAIVIIVDGLIRFANRRVSMTLGIPVEEIQGYPFIVLIHPDDRDRVVDIYQRRLRGEDVPSTYEFRIVTPSGETIWLENSAFQIPWEGRLAPISFLRDVTKQKQLESQLLHSQKMEAVGLLAGGVAHDFNNLLSVIIGYTDIMLEEADPESFRSEVAEIRKAGERAAELTRQLLAYSRKQVLQPKVVSLNQIVEGVEKILRRLIGEDVELVTTLSADTPPVLVDSAQIGQVVVNLAVNARDAMPSGGRLTIRTERVFLTESEIAGRPGLHPGPHAMLSVSDTGVGMDAGTAGKIFDPFFTTKERGKGTGLGLSTVEGIVRQSRGHVAVDSAPGAGATFRVYLPASEEALKPTEAEPVSEARAGGSETILVVEDEPSVRMLIVQMLAVAGYTIVPAGDGEEALRLASEHAGPIHLLLTDVIMPVMNGRELAEKVSAARPGVRVIFMSGYTDDVLGGQGEMPHFIEKPFSPSNLRKTVRSVLDGNQ